MKTLFFLLFPITSLAVGDSQAQEVHVAVREAKIVATTAVVHHAFCPQGEYMLRIDRGAERLTFAIPGAREYDQSRSAFGAAFLHRPLYGNFGMTCGPANLNVYFRGVELQANSQPRPVAFNAMFFDDGKIDDKTGLEERDLDFINQLAR
jgi:hypothetical protein